MPIDLTTATLNMIFALTCGALGINALLLTVAGRMTRKR